ncbi:hypothetical protein L3X38_028570 [Prunus dulcis]|uniref:Uncharacterized protein n=1 Tax=Prunus dulcis TaxID=3755 RepID=A0AAD4VRE1_PRUDU|nr:hypothetical protein L3X38_028570 [Prunus dulcis]
MSPSHPKYIVEMMLKKEADDEDSDMDASEVLRSSIVLNVTIVGLAVSSEGSKDLPWCVGLGSVSLDWYSGKHTGQVLSLGLGISQLSPSRVVGYDSMVGASRPVTIVGSC